MLKRVKNNYSKTKQPVSKPVKNLITGECFLSISEAKKKTKDNSIQDKLKKKKKNGLIFKEKKGYCIVLMLFIV